MAYHHGIKDDDITTLIERTLTGQMLVPYDDGHDVRLRARTDGTRNEFQIWCEKHNRRIGSYDFERGKIAWTDEQCSG